MKSVKIYYVFLALVIAAGISSCKKEDSTPQPAAKFTFVVDGPAKMATFTNTSLNSTGYAWSFGDGTVSILSAPVHTYAQGGNYVVTLTAVGAAGTTTSIMTDTVKMPFPKNYLKGGDFEPTDVAFWTVNHQGQMDSLKVLQNVKYAFGYTTYKPTLGSGGCLYIFPANDHPGKKNEEGTLFSQSITLDAGNYQISYLIKEAGEDKVSTTTMANEWFEFYLNDSIPIEGKDSNIHDPAVSGWYYGGWTGWQVVLPALDGLFPHKHITLNRADVDGVFPVTKAGTYSFIIKVGKGGGSTFGAGIAIDKLTLNKLGTDGKPIY